MKKEKEREKSFILWFDEIGIEDISLVGGKNASLGEMLKETKVKIPQGFAITAYAYRYTLEKAGILHNLKDVLHGLDIHDSKALDKAGEKARKLIMDCELPRELQEAISNAYNKLSSLCKIENLDVAVRSSATAEDLPSASFAGQQQSFLNICGLKQLLDACKRCFASLFTSRAIVYRHENKFDHFKVYLSIGVQKMVRSDLASAGVIFTLDTESGFPDIVFITGSYGLGESVVQGAVNPDEFYVFKHTFKQGYKPLMESYLANKEKNKVNELIKLIIENIRTIYDNKSRSYILRELALNLFVPNNEKERAKEMAMLIPDETIRTQVLNKINASK